MMSSTMIAVAITAVGVTTVVMNSVAVLTLTMVVSSTLIAAVPGFNFAGSCKQRERGCQHSK
jgi:hypothetical protein